MKVAIMLGLLLAGCTMASGVMDAGNGTYMISAAAAPAAGGAAAANSVAYRDANKFCVTKGTHAVVITADSRDVYQQGYAAGNADLRFRCEQ